MNALHMFRGGIVGGIALMMSFFAGLAPGVGNTPAPDARPASMLEVAAFDWRVIGSPRSTPEQFSAALPSFKVAAFDWRVIG